VERYDAFVKDGTPEKPEFKLLDPLHDATFGRCAGSHSRLPLQLPCSALPNRQFGESADLPNCLFGKAEQGNWKGKPQAATCVPHFSFGFGLMILVFEKTR
jgi:hypothetical protein